MAAILIVTILVEIFTPQIMVLFVPGFVGDPEKFDLTVFLTRIMFPYLACMSLMAAYAAILNSLGGSLPPPSRRWCSTSSTSAALIPLAILTLEAPDTAVWVAIATMRRRYRAAGAGLLGDLAAPASSRSLRWPRFDTEVRRT